MPIIHMFCNLTEMCIFDTMVLSRTMAFYVRTPYSMNFIYGYLQRQWNGRHGVSLFLCIPQTSYAFIPNRLLPLTRESSSVRESTMQIITRLVMCEQQEIQKAVAHLPPFPDTGSVISLHIYVSYCSTLGIDYSAL